ncbi:MAG: hypothetical protein IJ662_10550 [Clostridia bacterium]|nr:hypothetical protein [Clostridia bacterium]
MRKIIASGFLGLISTLWLLGIVYCAVTNLVDSWQGNRLIASISALGLTVPFFAALVVLALSVALLIYGSLKKSSGKY